MEGSNAATFRDVEDRCPSERPATNASSAYVLALLTLAYVVNSLDRSIMWVLVEPIKAEFRLSDASMGLLSGFAFAAIYCISALPLAYLADHRNRKVILAACLAAWSFMTILCGFAKGFWQLFFMRAGVGAAESGGPPASISMIGDLFPSRLRTTVLGIYMCAPHVGLVLVFLVGGWIAENYGWRSAFFIAGAPGLLIALLVMLTVKEPARVHVASAQGRQRADFARVLKFMAAQRSLLCLYAAMVIATIASSGVATFNVSFLVRSHGFTVASAGRLMAMAYVIAAFSVPVVGWIADRLVRRDERWWPWLCASILAITPIFVALIVLSSDSKLFWIYLSAFTICSAVWHAPGMAMLQSLVGPNMRAMAMAIQLICANLLGLGLGGVWVGLLSDLLKSPFGGESLRYAILIGALPLFIAALAMLIAAGTLKGDLSRANALIGCPFD